MRSQKQNMFENSIVLSKETNNKTIWKVYCVKQGIQQQYTSEHCIVLHKEAISGTQRYVQIRF